MVEELMEGSGVFCYSQRAYCSALKNWYGYTNAAVDIFFSKKKLASSCALGNKKESKTGDSHRLLGASHSLSFNGSNTTIRIHP